MASTNDVFGELKVFAAHMWRGYYEPSKPKVEIPGMVPDMLQRVKALGTRLAAVENRTVQSHDLLNAINVQTLGRMEQEINDVLELVTAVNAQTLGRVEGEIKAIQEFLPTLREDEADTQARLEKLKDDIEKGMAQVHAKLDDLTNDVRILSEKP